MKTLFTFLSILITFFLFAQQPALNPVTWKATYSPLPSLEGEIIITATIDDKWHIYSQRPTDAGPIPTSFSITPNKNIELLGKVEETNAHEEYVKAFEANVYVFDKNAVFKQKIKRHTKDEIKIKITLEYMTCNDMQCLPPKIVELELVIPSTSIVKK